LNIKSTMNPLVAGDFLQVRLAGFGSICFRNIMKNGRIHFHIHPGVTV
jgi:hypothetical protein